MSSFIEIKDLHFSYVNDLEEPPVKTEVLKGINLNIEKGEFVAVLGHNGSGKSTLAKCINAINLPESGAVYVNGMDTLDENNLLPIREKVGMVFQNPDNQIVATIVEEDVAFALENMGVEPNEIRRRVDEALKTVGMYEYRLHAPHKLSGGQKQRVAIAGIIAMKPDCIRAYRHARSSRQGRGNENCQNAQRAGRYYRAYHPLYGGSRTGTACCCNRRWRGHNG